MVWTSLYGYATDSIIIDQMIIESSIEITRKYSSPSIGSETTSSGVLPILFRYDRKTMKSSGAPRQMSAFQQATFLSQVPKTPAGLWQFRWWQEDGTFTENNAKY